ncbi:unnamed protein product [Rotaria sp. Silwood1]|nr:unnamed protein product [Rotaria sp. Silwood1]CAF1630833.1 unnamed protein product [Rotaria sp. Silwood1]CAF3744654.1 unnamed protein product [Rotaria sp. Silwood1]CAF3790024.1 unnamed protein product [Rotaria sp. Silwood1]CAF3793372.1 unnamed protein product [Rotaria sp. Silwood1]
MIITTDAVDNELHTRKGIIHGRRTEHTIEYLGIQYAKANRWQPPIDLAHERFPNGSFEATSFGPCCPQPEVGLHITAQDEQCLYLNIFTPINKSKKSLLPVLVWIHGGGLVTGCSSQSIPLLYNGTNIIRHSLEQPVIVITINYRLGIFSDMYLTELVEENTEWPTAANYNYLDILSALRWINSNIRDYDGDPNNVLLFGESAGGRAVGDIGAFKGSLNLYRHIISQSGGFGAVFVYTNISTALQKSNSIVKKLNCQNNENESVLECLRKVSVHDLIVIYGDGLTSVIDGYFFPYDPQSAIQHGTYNPNINMIVGFNKHELPMCLLYPDMNSTLAISTINIYLGEGRASMVINSYQLHNCSSNSNDPNRCCDIVGRLLTTWLGCGIRRLFNSIHMKYSDKQHNLFWYNLDCNAGICPLFTKEQGGGICAHTFEIPLVFGTESDYGSTNPMNCTWDRQTRLYSNKIISHWINMAVTGEPLKPWLKYDPSKSNYLQLTPYHEFSMESWNEDLMMSESDVEVRTVLNIFVYRVANG